MTISVRLFYSEKIVEFGQLENASNAVTQVGKFQFPAPADDLLFQENKHSQARTIEIDYFLKVDRVCPVSGSDGFGHRGLEDFDLMNVEFAFNEKSGLLFFFVNV